MSDKPSEWKPWFAWFPVRLLTMETAWLRTVDRRPARAGRWSDGDYDYANHTTDADRQLDAEIRSLMTGAYLQNRPVAAKPTAEMLDAGAAALQKELDQIDDSHAIYLVADARKWAEVAYQAMSETKCRGSGLA